jgi:hypothetical protein
MMKKMLLIMLIFTSLSAYAEGDKFSKSEYVKMRNFYLKQMEKAQPIAAPINQEYSIYDTYKLPTYLGVEDDGSYFLNSNTIDSEEGESQKMQNESSVAVNPTNPLNMIASAVDYRGGSSTWIYISHDGGKTWENKNLGKPDPLWRSTNDPSVTFDAEGTAYLMHGGFEQQSMGREFNGGNGIFVARSEDEGKTWKTHIPVIIHTAKQSPDSAFEDKYYVEADISPESKYFGRIYTPWKRVTARDSATQIMFSYSDDKGDTWSKPVAVSPRLAGTSEDTTFGQSFPLLETTPNGDVHAVWNNGIYHSVGYNKSTDGGESWRDPILLKKYNIFGTTKLLPAGYRHTVKGGVRAESYPIIRSDHSNSERRGWIYLVWTADSIPNVYFSRSTDNGETWSDATIVNQDLTNDQFWAWLAVDPTSGDIGVMYFDSRRDPDNMLVECWVSLSTDGGETWTDRPAGSTMHDLRLNPFSENSFAGDYSGMDFYNGIMYPTWVDMRAAVKDRSDSDVFTAIVDTKAPMPIENFEAAIIPENPEKINLTWVCPTEKSFGQPLSNEEYYIIIKRDGIQIDSLAGGTVDFSDEGLTPYQEYKYEIYASSLDGRESLMLELTTYPGGSAQPGMAEIMSYSTDDMRNNMFTIKMPNKRKDGTTALANLKAMNVYRDDELIETIDLTPADTSQLITFEEKVDIRGWYQYHFEIVDDFNGTSNSSDPTEKVLVYSGKNILDDDADFTDNFDVEMNHYYIKGEWQQVGNFAKSPDYSFSATSGGEYTANQNDTLMLFPIDIAGGCQIEFWHAAAVHQSDKARLQVSYDDGENWEEIAVWTEKDNENWTDDELNSSDWQLERFDFNNLPNAETLLVRFVFYSNSIKNDLGWYIDDLVVRRELLSVSEKSDLEIYPNPAKNILNLPNIVAGSKIEIFSVVGEILISSETIGNEMKIDISTLNSGTYFIRHNGQVSKFIKI